jgi:two-component system, NtrC family, response regulator AtoC
VDMSARAAREQYSMESPAVTMEQSGESTGETSFPERYLTEYAPLLGGSPAMCSIRSMVECIAITDAAVLLRGESGVGKDLVARALHAASDRSDRPFIKVNCAAIPHGLLESELFGHEKGAFTGAHRRRPGHFEYANKGTIYLDEIGELPLPLQAKVLHVLQDLTFSRVGGHELIEVDVRIVAATNRDLELAIARREFREDLYYRLNVVEIAIPPLRERKEEVLPLARRFLEMFNRQYGRNRAMTAEIERRLLGHRWPGNVRELENMVRRLVVLSDTAQIFDALGGSHREPRSVAGPPQPFAVEALRDIARNGAREAERKALAEVLERVNWNRAEAARVLKVSYKTLLNKISECGLKPPPARSSQPPST